ncbi:MAG: Gfo/Idh/MocA family oxidoreductase [Chloroflexi bacterium]|nr:Gfo/Idh/MocA family oxidoreductase [Chloroflexota bacterium]
MQQSAKDLRWGIAGLGQLADEWIAPAVAASASGRLVACASSDAERARRFAARHGAGRAHGSYEDLARDPEVDAIFVATANHLHTPVVMAAAQHGKHVLCEKPMALSTVEAEQMLAACRAAGVTLRIGLQLRFQEVLQAAAELVRDGRIGTVREVSAQRYAPVRQPGTWRRDLATAGAGALADVGVHVVDYVRWIVGDHVARVFAVGHPARASGRPDETVTLLLEFAGGCQAAIRCSRELPLGANDLQLFGTRGLLATGPLRWVETNRLVARTSEGDEERTVPVANYYLREIEAFAAAVAGEPTAAATGEDGLALVRVTTAAISSLETGAAVAVDG